MSNGENKKILYGGLTLLGVLACGSVVLSICLDNAPELRRFSELEIPGGGGDGTAEKDWHDLAWRARQQIDEKNFEAAKRTLRDILSVHPGAPDAWQLLGIIYYRQGDYELAEQAFRYLMRQQPHNAGGVNNLGQVLWSRGDTLGALAATEAAARLDPRNSIIQLNLATIYAKLNQEQRAIACLKRAVAFGANENLIAREPVLVNLINDPKIFPVRIIVPPTAAEPPSGDLLNFSDDEAAADKPPSPAPTMDRSL